MPPTPSDYPSSPSDEKLVGRHSGSGLQKDQNDQGEPSPSCQPTPFTNLISNSNLGTGTQSNNNDLGMQVVHARAREGGESHHDAAATAPMYSNPSGVSQEEGIETEIRNSNSQRGVQNNNNDEGTQHAYPDTRENSDGRPDANPTSQIQLPALSSDQQWSRQVHNVNTGKGAQNNNNDKGMQLVYPRGQISGHSSGALVSATRVHRVSKKRIINLNEGEGTQNNNNDKGIQVVESVYVVAQLVEPEPLLVQNSGWDGQDDQLM